MDHDFYVDGDRLTRPKSLHKTSEVLQQLIRVHVLEHLNSLDLQRVYTSIIQ